MGKHGAWATNNKFERASNCGEAWASLVGGVRSVGFTCDVLSTAKGEDSGNVLNRPSLVQGVGWLATVG